MSGRGLNWWQTGIVATGVILAGGLAFLGLLFFLLTGGVEWWFRDPPRPDDPEVVAAKADAIRQLEPRVDAVVALVEQTHPAARLVAQGPHADRCLEGSYNWKARESPRLMCRQWYGAVIVVDDLDGFAAQHRDLHRRLVGEGWRDNTGLQASVRRGWPPREGRVDLALAELQPASYLGSVGISEYVSFQWFGDSASAKDAVGSPDELRGPDGTLLTPRAVVRLVPEEGYAISVRVSRDYFRE